jgi:hypothetical protein
VTILLVIQLVAGRSAMNMWVNVYADFGLVLQYGHAISNAAIVVMPASSVVDAEVCLPMPLYILVLGFQCALQGFD